MASEWNAGTYYLPGQQAIVASIIYTATSTQPNQNRNPPSNPTWWNVATNFSVVVSATPEEWNAGTFYLPNQEVQWLSILYKATPVQPNRGRQPDNNPSWWLPSQTPGVTQIVAGSNITISPTNGLGAVTINATGGSNLVTSVSGSNAGISVSPTTGDVIIQNTGVTSIAVAGSGLATSGSAGALTLTATPQWVGTATGALNMNGYAIQGVGDVFSPGNIAMYTNSGHYAGFYQAGSYIQIDPSQNINLWAPTVNINNINIVNNGTGWGSGITHTLYGDVLSGGKYIKWSYDNNPGTQIADNSSIELISPIIQFNGPVNMLGDFNMYNHNIINLRSLYFQNGANIDGALSNQLNFNASNSYFLGNLRLYGTSLLDMANNNIYNVSYIYGNSSGNLNINATSNINLTSPHIELDRTGGGSLILDTNIDLNCANGRFLTLGNSGGGSFFQIQSGGAQILTTPAGQNMTLTAGGDLVLSTPNQTYFNNGGFVQFNCDHILMYRGYLQMNDNPIQLRADANHALAFGNAGTYNVGVDGPFLVGYRGGALGSSGTTFNDKSFAWSYSNLVAYKPLDMGNNNITNAGDVTIGSSYSLNMSTAPIKNVGAFGRTLASTNVNQPVIQYGVATGSGVSGSVSVTIPTTYTSTSSYVVQVTMRDSPTAQLYATPTSANTFTIGWTSAGAGTQNIMWTTFGS